MISHTWPVDPLYWWQLLRAYRWRWLAPALLGLAAGLLYAVIKSDEWEASQALVVREEAVGSLYPGRFDGPEARKTAQETVLELARSRSVVEAAMQVVGPPPGKAVTPETVVAAREKIKVSAPNGNEFGLTEVFYLKVSETTPARATTFTTALCDELERRLNALRQRKALSLTEELERNVRLAEEELAAATAKLTALEVSVGSDLGELRILSDKATGESDLRASLVEIKNEVRQAEAVRRDRETLRDLLREAQRDPNRLVGLPERLLEAAPAVRRLQEGLIDAEIATAQLQGQRTAWHPAVVAARTAADEVRAQLRQELQRAITGLESDIAVQDARLETLKGQQEAVLATMNRLAEVRADYSNLAALVLHRTEILKNAEQNLANARATRAAADSASLLTRIEGPVAGVYPVGPRRVMFVAAGAAAGLLCGLGLFVLTVPIVPVQETAGLEPVEAAPPPGRAAAVETFRGAVTRGGLSLKNALLRLSGGRSSSN